MTEPALGPIARAGAGPAKPPPPSLASLPAQTQAT